MAPLAIDLAQARILVTGGAGFVGSAFVDYVARQWPTAFILNVDALYPCARASNVPAWIVDRGPAHYVFARGKLQDHGLMRRLLAEHRIDVVVHFAAQSHVDHSFTHSLDYTFDNVLGTHVLLEACREVLGTQLRAFIMFSTDEVFGESQLGDTESDKKKETTMTNPTNPYAASKAASEAYARAYAHSFRMPIVITRCNNIYGPRQYIEKLIPRFLSLQARGLPLTIHGDGSTVRAFIHVEDVCRAVVTLLERGVAGEIYNIGSPDECSVLEIAERILAAAGAKPGPNTMVFVPNRPFNDQRYYVCDQKLRDLGWSPQIRFDDPAGLTATIAWYKAHPEYLQLTLEDPAAEPYMFVAPRHP